MNWKKSMLFQHNTKDMSASYIYKVQTLANTITDAKFRVMMVELVNINSVSNNDKSSVSYNSIRTTIEGKSNKIIPRKVS